MAIQMNNNESQMEVNVEIAPEVGDDNPKSAASSSAEEGLYTWQGHERTWLARGKSWYMAGGVIAIVLLVYALLTQAWTMAILISLLAGIVYLYSQEKSPIVDVVISSRGMYVGEDFYPFEIVKSFWFSFEKHDAFLIFSLVNSARSRVSISINPEERAAIQTVLHDYLVADDFHRESFWERIEKML